jgi:HprK-related kinase A
LIVADLSAGELRQRLRASGLRIRIGPIVVQVRSSFAVIESAIAMHYAAHETLTHTAFADFDVSVEPPLGARRWIRPQAFFHFDGQSSFLPLPATQAFALFEWGLNWCISAHCHQYLVIHAAVVERGDRVLMLPAPPGSGKSTLCAALVARGWRLLSDELALIELSGQRIVPLPRPISLKNASIPVIAGFWRDAQMTPVVHDTLKGSVVHVRPPGDSVSLGHRGGAPGWIVLPQYQHDSVTELVPLSKAQAFMRLVDSAFNYNMHGRAGFEVLADVVAHSACFQFRYSGALDEAVRVFDRLASA